jgi:hypothetical protein
VETPFTGRVLNANPVGILRQNTFVGMVSVCLLATLVLLISSRLVDLSRLHFGYSDRHLNDQVSYISVARNLVDTGTLSSNFVYPSVLYQTTNKNYLYMPGHYYALAVSYLVFGFGILQSFLPSLVSFVLASACTFLIGAKIYSRAVGFVSAILFILFPANIIYAYTAMSEMTLVFASTLAFCIFVYLPERFKPYVSPLLLIIPFIFRETGALLLLPMALMILLNRPPRIRATAVFLLASLAILILTFKSDISSGRPSLLYANMFDDSFTTTYTDAVAQRAISPHLQDWPGAVMAKSMRNLDFVVSSIYNFKLSFDLLLVLAILFILAFAIVYGIYKQDVFSLASGILALTTFLFALSFYALYSYRGLRILLFTYPLSAVFVAYLYQKYVLTNDSLRRTAAPALFRHAPLIILMLISFLSVDVMFGRFSRLDAVEDQHTLFLEQIGHDQQKMLVAPFQLSLDYAYRHHPLKSSFTPANGETFELLANLYDIGTVILPSSDYSSSFKPGDFERFGLLLDRAVTYEGQEYLIFKCFQKHCSGKPAHDI